jgi:hypothetical protein
MATTEPITATAITAPIIAYNSVLDIPEDAVKIVSRLIFFPLTVMLPDDGDTVYPDTEPIEYEYVPFAAVNVIVLVVEDSVVPLNVTDHDVPDGRPDSVNVTVYLTKGNDTDLETDPPFTVKEPEDGDGE